MRRPPFSDKSNYCLTRGFEKRMIDEESFLLTELGVRLNLYLSRNFETE